MQVAHTYLHMYGIYIILEIVIILTLWVMVGMFVLFSFGSKSNLETLSTYDKGELSTCTDCTKTHTHTHTHTCNTEAVN